MLEEGNGGCWICGKEPSAKRRLDMDHDHKEMYLRGLLCVTCNLRLRPGITAEWLQSAAVYLANGPVPYSRTLPKEEK